MFFQFQFGKKISSNFVYFSKKISHFKNTRKSVKILNIHFFAGKILTMTAKLSVDIVKKEIPI